MLTHGTSPVLSEPIAAAEAHELLACLKGQDHIAIAVSGGADSICLMHLAARWAAEEPDSPAISILTVDHGLRPESGNEARKIGVWAGALGLPHQILRWEGDKPERDVQAKARAARYQLMCGWCRDQGVPYLLLAHHQRDQAETVLMRLERGSGLDGLCGMSGHSWREGVRLFRPLLKMSPQRLRAHLLSTGHDWIEDPSNDDLRYERVQVRARLTANAGGRKTEAALARTASKLNTLRDQLECLTDKLMARAVIVSSGGFCHLDPEAFQQAPEELIIRALRRVIMAIGGGAFPPKRDRLERIAGHMIQNAGPGLTLAGCRLLRRQGRVWAVREQRSSLQKIVLPPGKSVIFDNRFAVRVPPDCKDQIQVRALGAHDWPAVRRKLGGVLDSLPAAAGQSLPGFYRNDELIALPFAGFGGDDFQAQFIQIWRLKPSCVSDVKPFRSR